jgi:hypothetical protein
MTFFKGAFFKGSGRFFIRLATGFGCVFCWSFFSAIIGITERSSPYYSVFGWGVVGTFVFGLWLGKKLFAKKKEVIFSNVKPKN